MKLDEIKNIIKKYPNLYFVNESEAQNLLAYRADGVWVITPSNEPNKFKIFYRHNDQTHIENLKDWNGDITISSEKELAAALDKYAQYNLKFNRDTPLTPDAILMADAQAAINLNASQKLDGLIPSRLLSQNPHLHVTNMTDISIKDEQATVKAKIVTKSSNNKFVTVGTLILNLSREELKMLAADGSLPVARGDACEYKINDGVRVHNITSHYEAGNVSSSLHDDKNKPVNLTITSEAYTKSFEYKKFRPEFFENTEENLQFAMQEAFHNGNNLKGKYIVRLLCAGNRANVFEINYFHTDDMYFQTLDPVKMMTNYDGFLRFAFEHGSSNTISIGQTIQELVRKAAENRGHQGKFSFEEMTEDEYLKMLAARYISTKSECEKSLNLQSSPASGLGRIIIDINNDGTVAVSIPKTNELRIITYFDFMRLVKGEAILSQPICYALRQDFVPSAPPLTESVRRDMASSLYTNSQPSAPEMSTMTAPTNSTRPASVVTSQFAQFSNTGTPYRIFDEDSNQFSNTGTPYRVFDEGTKKYKNIDEVLKDCDFYHEKNMTKDEAKALLLEYPKDVTQIFVSRPSSRGNDMLAYTFKVENDIHEHGEKKEGLFKKMNRNGEMNKLMTKSEVRARLVEAINEHLVAVAKEGGYTVNGSFSPYNDKSRPTEVYSNKAKRM